MAAHDEAPDALEILATSEAELLERVAALEALATERGDMCASYQLLAKTTLHALHDLTEQHARLQGRYHRLVDEYRQHRETLMAADVQRRAA